MPWHHPTIWSYHDRCRLAPWETVMPAEVKDLAMNSFSAWCHWVRPVAHLQTNVFWPQAGVYVLSARAGMRDTDTYVVLPWLVRRHGTRCQRRSAITHWHIHHSVANWRHSCSAEHITHQHARDCYYFAVRAGEHNHIVLTYLLKLNTLSFRVRIVSYRDMIVKPLYWTPLHQPVGIFDWKILLIPSRYSSWRSSQQSTHKDQDMADRGQ